MNRKAVLVIVALVLLIGIVAVVVLQQLPGSEWKATIWANPPMKEPCATCPTLSPKDPPWQKDADGLRATLETACADESCPEG